ncbi:hypothetical protein HDU93_000973 [Gonapodya sp. JEL0774]|nr:hypothetical protein HDU93_000973 [Gonapodya sp. JEL0774]
MSVLGLSEVEDVGGKRGVHAEAWVLQKGKNETGVGEQEGVGNPLLKIYRCLGVTVAVPVSLLASGGVGTPFNREQADTLRKQILEFRRIVRGLPIDGNSDASKPVSQNAGPATSHSPASESFLGGSGVGDVLSTQPQNAPEVAPSTPAVSASSSSTSVMATTGGPASATPVPSPYRINKDSNPYALLTRPISHADHAGRFHRLLVPAIAPTALDPATLARERDHRITVRVQARIHELEKLPLNIAGDPVGSSALAAIDANGGASSLKLRVLTELKALKLLPFQRELRKTILLSHTRSSSQLPLASLDRAYFRRPKKPSVREARSTDKLERQQRVERERKDKARQLEFVEQAAQQAGVVKSWHRQRHARLQRLGQAIVRLHSRVEKEEQAKVERLSKERLRALREDDEEAYLKLVESAKDTRITTILNQTSTFLKNLSAQVLAQQKAIGEGEPLEIDESQLFSDDDEEESDEKGKVPATDFAGAAEESARRRKAGKLDYYAVAHRIVEPVTEQPTIMNKGGNLKEYQIKGLEWMVSLYNNRLNGILADEMGLGKTIQTISLISYLVERKRQAGPFLVIVPLSTLTNWSMEFEKWAPSVSKIVYKGPPLARKALQQELKKGDFNVLLTTYQFVINDKDRPALSRIKWVYMIIDEGHRMKNTEAKLVQILTTHYSSRYRLILTGTPLQNNLPELWSLLNFICPKIFDSVKTFDEWFNSPFKGQAVAGVNQDNVALNEEEQLLIIKRLHKVLRPFLLRRLKKDVEAQLPGKTEKVIKCGFSALQQRLYDQIKKHGVLPMLGTAGKSTSGVKGLRNTLMHLRKVCNHPFAFHEVRDVIDPGMQDNMSLYRVSGKFELLDRILPKFFAAGHKVLMFFQMTLVMDVFVEYCAYRGIGVLRLDGHTKHEDRANMMAEFNSPRSDYKLFILSTRAGGLGLNLQVADTVIIFDSDWNPHQDLQAQDRAHRIGQTKEVKIFRLVTARSVEENILQRARYKLDMDSKVIQAGKFDNKSTNEEREAFLRSLLGGGEGGEGEDENENDGIDAEEEETRDEDLLEIIARNEEEMEMFRRMDVDIAARDAQEWRAQGQSPRPRLMQLEEVPEIFRKDQPKVVRRDDPFSFGRGRRRRDGVTFNEDKLANRQWEDSDVESDDMDGSDDDGTEDSLSVTTAGKRKRREDDAEKGGRGDRKRRMQDLGDDYGEETDGMSVDAGSVHNSEADEIVKSEGPRKRGRPKKVKPATAMDGGAATRGGALKIRFKSAGPAATMMADTESKDEEEEEEE